MKQLSSMEAALEPAVSTPLCVDLDGTLIRSDLLVESALSLLSHNPLMLFAMCAWLLRGKAHLKREIATRVDLDPATLPYNNELVDWLRTQRGHRTLVLCTASDRQLAERVAEHVGVFDDVMASDGKQNLSGTHKAEALVARFGAAGFDYVGNGSVDLPVWKYANAAIVVSSDGGLPAAAAKLTVVKRHFRTPKAGMKPWIKALRIHQWIKNMLIFLPLLAAHRIFDPRAVAGTALAFFSFCLAASSVYITNDLLDLASDRQHHRKRHRPFAAGKLPLVAGPVVALLLVVAAFGMASLLSQAFSLTLLGYFILTSAYSLRLKRIIMLDVVVLAMLYTSRILAGSAAIATQPSFWLLAFSVFIFLSLAMVKRYVELLTLQRAGKVNASGRGYDVEDIPLIQSMGSSSGYLSVLVLALYIDSTASQALYRHPHYLWMLCPLLLYWISRTWAIAHRGKMHDDPVVFAITDNTSRALLAIATVILAVSI